MLASDAAGWMSFWPMKMVLSTNAWPRKRCGWSAYLLTAYHVAIMQDSCCATPLRLAEMSKQFFLTIFYPAFGGMNVVLGERDETFRGSCSKWWKVMPRSLLAMSVKAYVSGGMLSL